MKSNVYVVTMYRWGDRERYSYVLGVFTTKTKAEEAGESERKYRGGNKYYPEVLEVPLDSPLKKKDFKVVVELEHNPDFCKLVRHEEGE